VSYTITYSADLVRNFLQDDIVAPGSKFEALQGQDGASLLFSMGTDSALYVLAELPASRSGWGRTDISSTVLKRDFAGNAAAHVKDFATAQRFSGTTTTIHLSMVVTDGRDDHLYLSMNNPNSGPDWAQTEPAWIPVPFDDPYVTLAQLVIAGVFISEATDHEYIVVDIIPKPGSSQPIIARYYIDPSKTGKQAWQPHDSGIDLAATGYVSCLGRKWGEDIDGLYTSGQISSSPQLQYQPLFDEGYGTGASRFKIPGGLIADNIAATRNADNTSDLYITAGGGLYYLSSKTQKDGTSATFLFSNDLLKNVQSLFATAVPGGGAIVWGRNAVNQVFYVTCAASNPATAVWSKPLPIMTAEQVSPYLDRDNDANTFFAHTALGKLTKSVRSADTTMWTSREITLAPQAITTPARNFSSYTTTVRITDESDQPVEGAEVTVQAANNTHAYINYQYFVLASTPATVLTDSDGTITIIEPADGVAGTRLAIRVGDAGVEINPMDTAFRKASSLTTSQLLIDAKIVSPDGTETPLLSDGTPSDSLQAAADGNTQLAQAYDDQQGMTMLEGARASRARRAAAAIAERQPGAGAHAPAVQLPGGLSSILVDAGDLFLSYAEQAVKTIAQVVIDAETGLYAFVAQIGGEFFHCLLDCIESIASGAWHLLMMLVEEIEEIIKFLEFLFEWRDISRTKDVVANIIKVTLEYQIGQFAAVRPQFDEVMDSLQQEIASWSNLDWSGLGDAGDSTPDSSATGVPQQTSPSALVTHHYQNNAQGASQLEPDSVTAPDSPLAAVIDALSQEGNTLSEAISQVLTLATELPTMPLEEALTTFAGILGETLVESARNALDPFLDIATDLGSAMLAIFEAPIHIPVVSDILEYFGVPALSFLDIAAWLAALPGTILYKIAVQEAPFPDDDETSFLISAPDWPTLLAGVTGQPQLLAAPAAAAGSGVGVMAGASAAPADKAIEFFGHFLAGIGSLGQAIVGLEEPLLPAGSRLGKWATLWSVIGGASGGAASWATSQLVPANAVKNTGMVVFGDVLIALRLYLKYCGAVAAMDPFGAPITVGNLVIKDYRGLFSFFDALLGLLSVGVTICHFTELATTPGESDVLIAVIDEVSNLAAVAARVSYPFAVNAADPDSATAAIVSLTVCNLLTSDLQLAVCPLVVLD
jgi:hypothetical protein